MNEILYTGLEANQELANVDIDRVRIVETMGRMAVLLDVDGTTSSTPVHMQGFNTRLSAAFPRIGAVLPEIKAKRAAFREELAHLSFAEQDEVWQQRYPGTTSHNQLDIYRVFAPEVFDEATVAAVNEWAADPENFGYAEYDDVAPMFAGLQRLGVQTGLLTLGQYRRPDGMPGWQQQKIHSSPRLRMLPNYVVETLPAGGKPQLIGEADRLDEGVFRIPLTEGGTEMVASAVVMVDDSKHNVVGMPPNTLGILVDRSGKYRDWQSPANTLVVSSLAEVPAAVETFAYSLAA